MNSILLILSFIAFFGIITIPKAKGQIAGNTSSQTNKPELVKEKQTTLGLYVTSREAYTIWKSNPENIKIIDVRTPEEYIFIGHANMAWNIPLATQSYEWDSVKQMFKLKPNPDFIPGVKKIASLTDTLLVTCRSGGRSAMAVNQLAAAGFKNVYNITDGVEGDLIKDPDSVFNGQRMKNGWKNSGLPWTYDVDPKQMQLPGTVR
jgi:rhodanese-related sulfurtransferase